MFYELTVDKKTLLHGYSARLLLEVSTGYILLASALLPGTDGEKLQLVTEYYQTRIAWLSVGKSYSLIC